MESGRDYVVFCQCSKVSQIKKKVTTADGVVALYGEPDTKEIVSSKQVMWHYTFLKTEHVTRSGVFALTVETTTGYKKELDILLQNDVVVNFTYVKVPIQSEKDNSGSQWSTGSGEM